MSYKELVDVGTLTSQLDDPTWAVVDCRFGLADPSQGARDYRASHVAGAVFADLDRDLAGPVVPGRTGRHPLPAVATLAATFGAWGIGPDTQVVAYDAAGGAMVGARLWWLLRWLGHEAVAVLDGGWQAWQVAGLPVRSGVESRAACHFQARPRPEMAVDAATAARLAADPAGRLLDARAADRFRGEDETVDPVAGHIPGAISAPYADNLGPDGRWRRPEWLRDHYRVLLAGESAERAVVYCGSGVTAAHDILAMRLAGLGEPRLYAGSWSEWITDPTRPVAR